MTCSFLHHMVTAVTSAEQFNQTISSNPVVVVDFHATWCGPCRMIAPKVEQFAKEYSAITFIKVDVDEVPEVAEKAGIRAMPTFQIFKDGKQVLEIVGADPNKLEAAIKSYA